MRALSVSDPSLNGCGDQCQALEAEAVAVNAVAVLSDPLASQASYVKIITANAGTIKFTFDIATAAAYRVWCRVLANDALSDSFFVSMDGGAEDVYDTAENLWSPLWQYTLLNGRGGSKPLTLNPRLFNLAAGTHQLVLRGRDLNSTIDRIIITSNATFVPQNALPTPTPVPTPTPTPIPTPTPTPIPTPTPTPVPTPIPNEFYVAPNGSASNSGTIGSPWDLQTAFNMPAAIKPGAIIWMRAGIYTHAPQGIVAGNPTGYIFASKLLGTSAQPIVVRPYLNEKVIVDGGAYTGVNASGRPTIAVYGAYTWFRDFEIASLSTEARFSPDDSSFPLSITRSDGPNVYGVGIKLINLVIHDLTAGISAWGQGGDFEAYGNVVFNNGWQGTPHPHGHNVYTQNYARSGPKFYTDNIFLNAYQNNLQAYGSSAAEIAHMRINQNTFLNSEIIIGGRTNAQLLDNQFSQNLLFRVTPQLQYSPGPFYKDIIANGNYLVDGRIAAGSWQMATITNNKTIVTTLASPADWMPQNKGDAAPPWNWNNNTYIVKNSTPNSQIFAVEGEGFFPFAKWQIRTKFDLNSTLSAVMPTVNFVTLKANQYDANRAQVIIYNWENLNSVVVPTSTLGWKAGDSLEIHSTEDYLKDVQVVAYNGNSITFDMQPASHSIAVPLGATAILGPDSFPKFGAFVVIKR